MPTSRTREEQIKTIKDIFVSLMWIAARHLSHRVQTYGLTHPQFMVLISLAAHQQACTMRDLTDITFQDPPTMTGIIDRLVRMNLVRRTRSDHDRRVVLVEATSVGVELINRFKNETMQEDVKGYAKFSDEDLSTLEQSLRYLLRMHVGQYMSLQGADLDAEIEKLQSFRNNPIHYVKSNDEKVS